MTVLSLFYCHVLLKYILCCFKTLFINIEHFSPPVFLLHVLPIHGVLNTTTNIVIPYFLLHFKCEYYICCHPTLYSFFSLSFFCFYVFYTFVLSPSPTRMTSPSPTSTTIFYFYLIRSSKSMAFYTYATYASTLSASHMFVYNPIPNCTPTPTMSSYSGAM